MENTQISDHVQANDDICETGECCRLARIETKVNELYSIVIGLLNGAKEAQQSSGMAGMMARQMFPDMSQFVPAQSSPVTEAASGQNGV